MGFSVINILLLMLWFITAIATATMTAIIGVFLAVYNFSDFLRFCVFRGQVNWTIPNQWVVFSALLSLTLFSFLVLIRLLQIRYTRQIEVNQPMLGALHAFISILLLFSWIAINQGSNNIVSALQNPLQAQDLSVANLTLTNLPESIQANRFCNQPAEQRADQFNQVRTIVEPLVLLATSIFTVFTIFIYRWNPPARWMLQRKEKVRQSCQLCGSEEAHTKGCVLCHDEIYHTINWINYSTGELISVSNDRRVFDLVFSVNLFKPEQLRVLVEPVDDAPIRVSNVVTQHGDELVPFEKEQNNHWLSSPTQKRPDHAVVITFEVTNFQKVKVPKAGSDPLKVEIDLRVAPGDSAVFTQPNTQTVSLIRER